MGQNGQFVFVVKPDSTVENVPVTVSNSIGGLNVVQKGLQPGDQVVTDGQAKSRHWQQDSRQTRLSGWK